MSDELTPANSLDSLRKQAKRWLKSPARRRSRQRRYLSLRRNKQFATVGPATKTAVEIGLNAKDLLLDKRLIAIPPGAMCRYRYASLWYATSMRRSQAG